MKFCPNYSAPLRAIDKPETEPALVYRARCKQWTCTFCAEINRKVWRARIMLEVEKDVNLTWHFWTLTLDGDDHRADVAYSLQVWREVWDTLMKRIKRDLKHMRYLRVFETHKDGTLHVHMLTDMAYSDVKRRKEKDGRYVYESATLAKHLEAMSLGWRHDIRPIVTKDTENNGNARNVSAYVVKYLTKSMQSSVRKALQEAGLMRVRMIQTSAHWSQVPAAGNERVWEAKATLETEFAIMQLEGRVLYDTDLQREVEMMDFGNVAYYPNRSTDDENE